MAQVEPSGAFVYNDPGVPYTAQPQPVAMTHTGQLGQPVMLQMPSMPADVMCRMSGLPVNVHCPLCQTDTTTTTEKVVGARAYMMVVACFCMCTCCLLPCVWDSLKDVVHYCGNCKAELGRHIPHGRGGRARRR